MPDSPFRAGQTVCYRPVHHGDEQRAAVVEVHPDGTLELDNNTAIHPDRDAIDLVDTGERWLPVAGYDGKYEVSSQGKVVATDYNRQAGRRRLLKPARPTTYPLVTLTQAGQKPQQIGLNRLVMQHFGPAPASPAHTHLLPLDGNILNLDYRNWRWAPVEETGQVGSERLRERGTHYRLTLTDEQVRDIRERKAEGLTQQAVADEFGISRSWVSRLAAGKDRAGA